MKTERAIELLNRISDSQFDGVHGDERREALEMAVRALFSQQIVNDSQGLVNDCISRKMAIDAFEPEHDTDWYTPQIIEVLEALPSAQPETHDKRTETHECDLISRQAAIAIERNATVDTNPSHFEAHQKFTQFMDDAEVSSFGRWQWSNGFNTALTAVGIDLKNLPSAQPERKKGKWIENSEPNQFGKNGPWYWKCSNCGHIGISSFNFCPFCGARMDGGESE